MDTYEGEVRVAASPEQVWAVLVDHARLPRWVPDVAESVVISGDGGLGTRRRVRLGPMEVEQEITEWQERTRFSYSVGSVGPFRRATTRWALEPDGDQTAVHLTAEIEPQFGLLGWLLRGRLRKTTVGALAGLKHHVETGEDVSGVPPGAAEVEVRRR